MSGNWDEGAFTYVMYVVDTPFHKFSMSSRCNSGGSVHCRAVKPVPNPGGLQASQLTTVLQSLPLMELKQISSCEVEKGKLYRQTRWVQMGAALPSFLPLRLRAAR